MEGQEHQGLHSLSGRTSYCKIPWSHKITVYNFQIALKLDGYIDSSAAKMRVKFQSVTITTTPNLAASSLHEILR